MRKQNPKGLNGADAVRSSRMPVRLRKAKADAPSAVMKSSRRTTLKSIRNCLLLDASTLESIRNEKSSSIDAPIWRDMASRLNGTSRKSKNKVMSAPFAENQNQLNECLQSITTILAVPVKNEPVIYADVDSCVAGAIWPSEELKRPLNGSKAQPLIYGGIN